MTAGGDGGGGFGGGFGGVVGGGGGCGHDVRQAGRGGVGGGGTLAMVRREGGMCVWTSSPAKAVAAGPWPWP